MSFTSSRLATEQLATEQPKKPQWGMKRKSNTICRTLSFTSTRLDSSRSQATCLTWEMPSSVRVDIVTCNLIRSIWQVRSILSCKRAQQCAWNVTAACAPKLSQHCRAAGTAVQQTCQHTHQCGLGIIGPQQSAAAGDLARLGRHLVNQCPVLGCK